MNQLEKVSLRRFEKADYLFSPLEDVFSASIDLLGEHLLGGFDGTEKISDEPEGTTAVSCC